MAQTFEEMCAERDPLYAAMEPAPMSDFMTLKILDRCAHMPLSARDKRWYTLRRDQITREIQYRVNSKKRNDAR